MNRTEIQNYLAKRHNGTYTNITFLSDVISNKDHKEVKVQKIVEAVVRFGVQYSHIQVEEIQARPRDNTTTEEKLPWGEWDIDCPYLISHKDTQYLRCTVSRSPKHHRRVRYLVDGVEVTKEQAMVYTRPSEWVPREKEEYVFNPKIENVLRLGKEVR